MSCRRVVVLVCVKYCVVSALCDGCEFVCVVCWMLTVVFGFTGCWLLNVDHWLLVVGCWLLIVERLM